MRRILFLSIDRSNPRASMQTLNEAAQQIKDDQCNVLVYPEGTRSMDDYQLLPFHDGVFKIAKKAGVPIVVLTTIGTEQIAGNYPLHPTKVQLDILETIPADFVKENSTHVISARVRELMLSNLTDYPASPEKDTSKKEEDAPC